MLIPISFGIGATLTTLVGTNIGARQHSRVRRIAWIGALMAGGLAAVIGLIVAIWPDLWLWLGLFTNDPRGLATDRHYLSIVGPAYGFFGIAMALYFARHWRDVLAGGRQFDPTRAVDLDRAESVGAHDLEVFHVGFCRERNRAVAIKAVVPLLRGLARVPTVMATSR